MVRPREFDKDEVIQQTINVFHHQGYGETSIADLVKETGLQPGSLYAAFKNKKDILIVSLKAYADKVVGYLDDLFTQFPTALDGVKIFLLESSESCKGEDGSYGCFMVNSLLELATKDQQMTEFQKGYSM